MLSLSSKQKYLIWFWTHHINEKCPHRRQQTHKINVRKVRLRPSSFAVKGVTCSKPSWYRGSITTELWHSVPRWKPGLNEHWKADSLISSSSWRKVRPFFPFPKAIIKGPSSQLCITGCVFLHLRTWQSHSTKAFATLWGGKGWFVCLFWEGWTWMGLGWRFFPCCCCYFCV